MAQKKAIIDLDAVIQTKTEERIVKLGGRQFDVSLVPVGVAATFLKGRIDPSYSSTEAMTDAAVIMLNQSLPTAEQINKEWFLLHVDGSAFEAVIDVILSPFFEKKEMVRKAMNAMNQDPIPEPTPT